MSINSYEKPSVKSQKIKFSFFMSSRFLNSVSNSIVPAVFAQSSCECASQGATCDICGGGTCNSGGGDCSSSNGSPCGCDAGDGSCYSCGCQ